MTAANYDTVISTPCAIGLQGEVELRQLREDNSTPSSLPLADRILRAQVEVLLFH